MGWAESATCRCRAGSSSSAGRPSSSSRSSPSACCGRSRLRLDSGKPFPQSLQAFLLSRALSVLLRALSFAVFVVIWSAATFGSPRASQNIAPTFIYVLFWVGMPVASVALGNIWSVLDPWRAGADGVAWICRRVGVTLRTRHYPEAVGVWPAMVLFLCFTALELVYTDPADPRMLTTAILVYSIATWSGMLLFGRSDWRENGDGFAVYFELLSRVAVFGTRHRDGQRELVLRQPLSQLTRVEARPGAVAFVAVMLGTVAFDGISRSTRWLDLIYNIETSFSSPSAADRGVMLVSLAGMLVSVVVVAGLYLVAVRAAEQIVGRPGGLKGVFLGSLIPIAFVYALSHYFSLLVVQSQFAIPLAFDPYDLGWGLFGSEGFQPRLDVLQPNTTWYVQVAVLVLGHVAGLIVAHDRAVAVSPSPRVALRTQYVMLTLMVLYTVGGMWLLSIG
jgi:hypothetical protein